MLQIREIPILTMILKIEFTGVIVFLCVWIYLFSTFTQNRRNNFIFIMIKKKLLQEISIAATQSKNNIGNNEKDVFKIQSWLNLFAMANPSLATSISIDGDFGQATELAVKKFQELKAQQQTGIVDAALFSSLSEPLSKAFQSPANGNNLRNLVCNVANMHLVNHPFELMIKGQSNCGPWVRSYMDGNEGTQWFWCMGFVQSIIDQAASEQAKDFRTLMPLTYSCDTIGTTGLHKNLLHRFDEIRSNPALVKRGDIFLLQKTPNDWIHAGLI